MSINLVTPEGKGRWRDLSDSDKILVAMSDIVTIDGLAFKHPYFGYGPGYATRDPVITREAEGWTSSLATLLYE